MGTNGPPGAVGTVGISRRPERRSRRWPQTSRCIACRDDQGYTPQRTRWVSSAWFFIMFTTTKCSILATALLLAGCAHNASPISRSWDDGVSAVQPKDIAVPKGMRLLEDPSHSDVRESGSYRYANLTYEGSTPVTQVATYLLGSMPLRNYQLESRKSPGPNHQELRFRRGPYVLDCSIQRLEEPPVTRLVYKLRTHVKPE